MTAVPRQGLIQTLRLIRSDMRFRCEWEHRPLTAVAALKLIFNPGMLSVILIRLQRLFDTHFLRPLGWLIEMINLVMCSVHVDPRARIAGGLVLIHPHSVFISGDVEIGPCCILFHQNALGFSPFVSGSSPALPTRLVIGRNVVFGAGACAYGDIVIGDRCKIGVNAVVESSFPADSVLFGVPARVVSRT
jgi:serine acetyltransferase